jgi:Abnormal spindle-like microcephaly-assoc'd, ASPM-SPD-2-Hydin/Glycosyl hydrolases family 39
METHSSPKTAFCSLICHLSSHVSAFGRRRPAARMLSGVALALGVFQGTNCLAAATVSPTSLTWASVAVGNSGAQKVVTLTNGNSAAITISSKTLSGTNPGDFKIFSTTCGSSLGAGASCTANIIFTPTVSGTRTATLNFNDSDGTSPQKVSLSGLGTGGAGVVSISPTSFSFGSVNVGSTSGSQTATLKNGSSASITINSIATTGTNHGDFLIASKTCGSSLAAGASCTISVTFKPAASGPRAGTLTVSDTSSNSPQTVALSGTGGTTASGTVSVSPTGIGFPSTAVGSTSGSQTATLSNGTKSAITISSVGIGGANPGDFILSAKTCGSSLAASASCSATVAFKPTAAGTRTATLSFAGSSPQTVALSGTGGTSNPGAFQIRPTNPTVIVSNSLEFAATTDVTWLQPSCGLIGSTSGNYTAPSTPGTCTVTAQISGGNATVSTTVKVVSGPASGTLAVYPTSAAVYAGTTQVFQAQLGGVPDGHSLTYSVDGGTVTNQGIYTAPGSAGTFHLTVRDNSLGTTATATISVFTKVTVDFASRSTSLRAVPSHLFGAERMDSLDSAGLQLVKDGGINYARFYALIPSVFPSTESDWLTHPNWSPIDGNIRRISTGGVKVILQMHQSPPALLPSANPCGTGISANDAMPKDVNQWAQMAAMYVNHLEDTFPGVVTDYEIWNEPNTGALCLSTADNQKCAAASDKKLCSYLRLYDAAAPLMTAAISAHHSSARVGGPATAGFQSTWVKAMLADSVASQNMGFMAYHDYMFSSAQTGAQWDTYNGTISIYQRTQNTGAGPMATYLYASSIMKSAGKNIPLYNTEYNLNWAYAQNCCQNDPIYSPVWNGMYVADVLNSVYNSAHPNVIGHMVYFATTVKANLHFCLIGEINSKMDCAYPPSGTPPQPYPQYFLYQMLGSTRYLGLQNGGYMANTISPGTLGNGLVVTAFFTTANPPGDAIVLINPTANSLDNITVTANNTGIASASGTLYQIVNGQSIQSSSVSPQSQGGTSYSFTVSIPAYTVEAISIHP